MLEESSRSLSSIFKVIVSEYGKRMLLKKDPKVSRDYLEIETDAQSLLRIIIMKVFRRDLQGIFLGMKDIPTRDVSAFTMVMNLIIGSLFILLSYLNSLSFFKSSSFFFYPAPFIPESHHFKTGKKSVSGNEVSRANSKLFIGK
jgi:hypothetical protein